LHIQIIAVGRGKGTPEDALAADYRERIVALGRKIGVDECSLIELEDRKAGPGRKEREAALIKARVPQGSYVVALDERGEDIASAKLAARLRARLEAGTPSLSFIIGGADGLADEILNKADLKLAFGRATWPHLLVRTMVAEQLYRAVTILMNHPYHRA
jgi:23S rRNA (pseudouridine1915-N3)-methyltransferase